MKRFFIISTKNNFELGLGIWPARFYADDVMYCNTAYGDYPTLLPEHAKGNNFSKGLFTGWMLLNYQKSVQVSSTIDNKGKWFQTDLSDVPTINAIQINYADQDVAFLGKTVDQFHQYIIKSEL